MLEKNKNSKRVYFSQIPCGGSSSPACIKCWFYSTVQLQEFEGVACQDRRLPPLHITHTYFYECLNFSLYYLYVLWSQLLSLSLFYFLYFFFMMKIKKFLSLTFTPSFPVHSFIFIYISVLCIYRHYIYLPIVFVFYMEYTLYKPRRQRERPIDRVKHTRLSLWQT